MPQTTPPSVDTLPAAPSTTSPSTFDALSDAFVAALATLRTQLIALATNGYNNAVDCYNNAVAGAASAATSTAQAVIATAQAVIATAQASAAAASAATAASAPGTSATSTTSLLVGSGALSLTIQTGKSLVAGMNITIARTSDPVGVQMAAIISAYNSGTGLLNFTASSFSGAGTFTDWTVSLSGARGATGATGPLYVAMATNAVVGNSYLAGTSASAFTITLPASPIQGDVVTFADAKGTWATNNLTIARNGKNILDLDGIATAEDLVCDLDGIQFTLFYDAPNWRLI